jgi:hypothetical protein
MALKISFLSFWEKNAHWNIRIQEREGGGEGGEKKKEKKKRKRKQKKEKRKKNWRTLRHEFYTRKCMYFTE